MTGETVLKILREIESYAEPGYGIFVSLSEYDDITAADTNRYLDGIVVCSCGIKGLEGNKAPMKNHEAATPIVGLCHELYGHGLQAKAMTEMNEPLCSALVLSFFACDGSPVYYGRNCGDPANYGKHSSEVAAQYVGLRKSEWLLKREVGL